MKLLIVWQKRKEGKKGKKKNEREGRVLKEQKIWHKGIKKNK